MPHKILIAAEDNAERDALEKYLGHSLGYSVAVAGTGAEALEIAAAGSFDLYMVQVLLPDVSGIETYMRLRTIDRDMEGIFLQGNESLTEKDADYLHFSVPSERVLQSPLSNLGHLTRLIIGILGPPPA
jgi:CheY-like chemotaxis protein